MDRTLRTLHELVVMLDQVDDGALPLTPEQYQTAARETRRLVARAFGGTSIAAFADALDPLRETAENLYFEAHGRLADLDGGAAADGAYDACQELLHRMRLPRRRRVTRRR